VKRFIQTLIAYRGIAACLVLISLGLAAYSARTIRLRFQFRDFYDYPGNSQLALYKQDFEEFGDAAGYVIAMVEADNVFAPEVLDYLRNVTATLELEKSFARVRSLTNVHAIRASGDDIVAGPLLSFPLDAAALPELERFARGSALLRRRLVSGDGKATAILAEMKIPATFSTLAEQHEAMITMERALGKTPRPGGLRVAVTGAPAIQVGVTTALLHDQMVLMPAVLAVLSFALFLSFRSFHGILLCLSAVSVATLWTAGLFALLQRPVDLIGSLIPTTILVYGVVDPIFVLARVLAKLDAGLTKLNAIAEAFSELGLPCFLTSLTTALGFAAFVTAAQPTIAYFGLTVAVGVLLAWLTSVIVLPLLIWWVPAPQKSFSVIGSTRRLDQALSTLWGFLRVRIPACIALTAVALVVSGFFASKQTVDNVYVDELPNGPARAQMRQLEQKLTGVLSLIVHLDGPADSMKAPGVLRRMQAIQREMTKEPLVTLSTSVADVIGEANQAFHGGELDARRVPESRSLIAQYLALIDPGTRALFVTEDFSRSHIVTLLADAGSERTRTVVSALRRAVSEQNFAAVGVSARLTGSAIVAYGELDAVVAQLVYGFVTAFAVIVVLQWLVFRSLRIALISVVPNLLPVIACFLTLRVLAIQLKIDTALVLCVSVGGLFNTTIHFAARVRQLLKAGESDPDLVIGKAMRAVGPPALFTALALSAGFAVLLLSSFPGFRALGLLSMITLSFGFLSDMVVTAVLLRVGLPWKAPMTSTPGWSEHPFTRPATEGIRDEDP